MADPKYLVVREPSSDSVLSSAATAQGALMEAVAKFTPTSATTFTVYALALNGHYSVTPTTQMDVKQIK